MNKEETTDPKVILYKVRVPEDAGEYSEALMKILDRIHDDWGKWISCDKGWYKLITDLDKAMNEIDPDYTVQQVKQKFGCYDSETDVLTQNGWVPFPQVTYTDKLAIMLENNRLGYSEPSDIISYEYNGLMYHLSTRGVDLLVTPNHNLYTAKGTYWNGRYKPPKKREYPFEFANPDKYFNKNKRFLKGTNWVGKEPLTFTIPSMKLIHDVSDKRGWNYTRSRVTASATIRIEPWLQLLGWYIAEGSISHDNTVDIAYDPYCNNEFNTIKTIVNSCGYIPVPQKHHVIRIYNSHLARWLQVKCGSLAPNKKVPRFIMELSPRLIEIFLRALYGGDGHQAETSLILTTTSPQLSDDAQELLFLAGYSARGYCPRLPHSSIIRGKIIQGKFDRHEVNWLFESFDHNTAKKGLAKSSSEKWVEYNGLVYCATVPGNLLYVRRNGRAIWCGNSLRYYFSSKNTTFKALRELVSAAEAASYDICELCGAAGQQRINDYSWSKTLCETCAGDKYHIVGEDA